MKHLALAGLVVAGLLAGAGTQYAAAGPPSHPAPAVTSAEPLIGGGRGADFIDSSIDGQPVIPVSPPDPTVDYGACAICNVPPFLQPGPDIKTLVFKPAETAVFGRVHRELAPLETDCLDALPYPTTGLEMGYYNFDGRGLAFGCQLNIIWQAGFNFDLSMLRQARDGGHWFPTDAVLTFKETPYPLAKDDPAHANHWQNGDGTELPAYTCWPRLATPTVDWSGGNRDLIANDVIREPNVVGRFSVYAETLGMVVDPATQRMGFLLLGDSESMDRNDAVCRSRIDNVQLTVTYTIGSAQPAAPTPAPIRVVGATTATTNCEICSVLGTISTPTPAPSPQPAAYHNPTPEAGTGWPQLTISTQGEAVKSLQYLLQAHGATLSQFGADGKFGQETLQAVRAFQTTQGLTVDGVVGQQTWLAVIVTVQQGSQGAAVKAVQSQLNVPSRLNARGGQAITVDGNFGPQTDAAVKTYQGAHAGLTVDGQVGAQTWKSLLVGN